MFLNHVELEDAPPNLWRQTNVLVWDDVEFGRVEFPAGSVTDLGSVPRALRVIPMFDPCGPNRRAAIGHDYLYSHGHWPPDSSGVKLTCTREQADRFLYVALLSESGSKAVARSWWLGVRAGGWVPWNAYRKAERDV
jgi:hypothetical protein